MILAGIHPGRVAAGAATGRGLVLTGTIMASLPAWGGRRPVFGWPTPYWPAAWASASARTAVSWW
jgi:hypothetical protein